MKFNGIISLTGYAIVIGSVGFFARMAEGLDLMTVVFFRSFLAAGFILATSAMTGSLKDLRPSNLPKLGLSAIFQGSMMLCFIGAALNTTIANAVFLTYTAPAFAILFSWLFLGEKVSLATIGSLVLTFVGVVLMVDLGSFSFGGEHLMGDLLALGAGISYAAVTITSKSLTADNGPSAIVFWQMALVAVALLPFSHIPSVTVLLPAAMPLLGLGVVATGCSYLMFMHGVKQLPGQQVLIITSLETVIPAGFAWFLFGEALSSLSILACGLILIGVIWVQAADVQTVPDVAQDVPTGRLVIVK